MLKALAMIVLGLLLGMVGTDVESGTPRYTFDLPELADGLNFVALPMGMFGLGEILRNLEHEETRSVMVRHVSGLLLAARTSGASRRRYCAAPGWARCSASCRAAGRARLFAAYTMEKKLSPNRPQFGKGAIEGVAAPEAPTTPARRPHSSRC